jgi:signal transduction histidine kinase
MSPDPRSLTFRLSATSILWVGGALLAVGFMLVLLFRDHIERRFDIQLRDHMEELVAASELLPDDRLQLTWVPSDPRFNRPLSGWYWQILDKDKPVKQSKSLWTGKLETHAAMPKRGARIVKITGPADEALRGLTEYITLPEAKRSFVFTVAGPMKDIEHDVALFTQQLTLTLGALALALLAAILIQVRFGLLPLRGLRREIAEIRSGARRRMHENVPSEVTPVVDEINALLDHNARMLEKARAQAANLAHALKNPLTVMRNEAGEIKGERGRILKDQTDIIGRNIERHLVRARAAGMQQARDVKTPLGPISDDLKFSMALLYKDRHLAIDVLDMTGLIFQGDPHDLEEMLGNLVDNACKWAKRRITIRGVKDKNRLIVTVEDDGPGISTEHIEGITRRGQRLDETVAGSGLGLDIVLDIAELYEGNLDLGRSKMGGLRAELRLPAAT